MVHPADDVHAPSASPADTWIYKICPSQPMPAIDLSRTLIRMATSSDWYQVCVSIMRRRFHQFAMIYRLAVAIFGVVLFVHQGFARTLLSLATIPSIFSLFSTAAFVSTDVLWHLVHNYEFWFLVTINTLNWSLLMFILNDVRAIPCFPAWLAFQTVIMMDANYRTYPTALSSTILSSPFVGAVAGLVAARCIRDGHYFELYIRDHFVGDATDFITFTSFTLVFFLVRIVLLKKVRTHHLFNEYKSIPCVVIKATLQLVPIANEDMSFRRDALAGSQPSGIRMDTHNFILCPLPISSIDARRTIMPYDFWKKPPRWIMTHSRRLRQLLYAVGTLGLGLLSVHTIATFWHDFNKSKKGIPTHPQGFQSVTSWSGILVGAGSTLSLLFCGSFVLFFQRDLLGLLFRNFDFLFSAVQTLVFSVCHCDLHNWDFERTVNIMTWMVWFFWTLTLDALTPIVKHHIFGFHKRFAAPVLVSIITGTAAIGLIIIFMPALGLHDRTVWSFRFSRHAEFTIRTQSLLLGRVVTIVLWCTRQAILLFRRSDHELNLIRGNVDYMSPYCTFPSLRTTTASVLQAQNAPTGPFHRMVRTRQLLSPRATLGPNSIIRSNQIYPTKEQEASRQ